jgi:hypothetical protein
MELRSLSIKLSFYQYFCFVSDTAEIISGGINAKASGMISAISSDTLTKEVLLVNGGTGTEYRSVTSQNHRWAIQVK